MRKLSLLQLLATGMVLSTLLLMATILVCLNLFTEDLRQQAKGYAEDTAISSAALLSSEIHSALNGASLIAAQQDIIAFPQNDAQGRNASKKSCQSLLNAFSNSRDMIVRSFLYTADGSTLYSYPENIDALSSHTYDTYRAVVREYALARAFRSWTVSRCYEGGGKCYFALLIPVYPAIAGQREEDYLGALVVVCDAGALIGKFPNVSGQAALLTEGERVIAWADEAFLEAWRASKAEGQARVGNARYELLRRPVPGMDWSLWLGYTYADAHDQTEDMHTLGLVLTVAFVVIQGLLTLLMYKGIVWPVTSITKQTDDVSLSAGDLRNPSAARNELTRLTSGINNMVRRVGQLSREKAEAELKFYRERTMFLQTQINPHFLYNNLECIRGMASDGAPEDVRAMASSMAAIYRYCARPGSTVPLREDLDCVTQYERIITLRYGSVYTLEMDVTEEAKGCAVPRMLLQPLAENSIRHGFLRANRASGRIVITARVAAGRLALSIEDDGAGMTQEEKARWNAPVDPQEIEYGGEDAHIGIGNVRSRLQLIFRGDCSMVFSDSALGGLRIDMAFKRNKSAAL